MICTQHLCPTSLKCESYALDAAAIDSPNRLHQEPEQEARDEPKKVGYKVFKDGKEAALYYRTLLSHLTKGQNLNEVGVNTLR